MSAAFSERRCRMVQSLSDAWWNLNDPDRLAPIDMRKLLDHRLRDTLTGVDCPQCVAQQLADELDKLVENDPPKESA